MRSTDVMPTSSSTRPINQHTMKLIKEYINDPQDLWDEANKWKFVVRMGSGPKWSGSIKFDGPVPYVSESKSNQSVGKWRQRRMSGMLSS